MDWPGRRHEVIHQGPKQIEDDRLKLHSYHLPAFSSLLKVSSIRQRVERHARRLNTRQSVSDLAKLATSNLNKPLDDTKAKFLASIPLRPLPVNVSPLADGQHQH
jgi:hypothetical protein